jgi:type IV secretory pathway TraG/TraD family ATPase VirD4
MTLKDASQELNKETKEKEEKKSGVLSNLTEPLAMFRDKKTGGPSTYSSSDIYNGLEEPLLGKKKDTVKDKNALHT